MTKLSGYLFAVALIISLSGCSITKFNDPAATSGSTDLPPADENTVHMCLMGGGAGCDIIMNPANKETYGAYVKKVCDLMPMPECITYFDDSMSIASGEQTTHTMNHADMVQSEFDFITLMIPHHQEAVDSTQTLLNVTQNSDITKLGKEIIGAQTQEITMMKQWLDRWFSGQIYTGMPYMNMMRDARILSATPTIEKRWLEDMIAHHQGALDMSNKLLKIMDLKDQLIKTTEEGGKFRADLRKFANDVINTQQGEIDKMKELLKQYQ